jgi:hypothetical protein
MPALLKPTICPMADTRACGSRLPDAGPAAAAHSSKRGPINVLADVRIVHGAEAYQLRPELARAVAEVVEWACSARGNETSGGGERSRTWSVPICVVPRGHQLGNGCDQRKRVRLAG